MTTTNKKPSPAQNNSRMTPKRAAQLKRQQERRRKRILLGVSITTVLVAIAVVAIVFLLPKTTSVDIPGVVTFSNLSRNHVEGAVSYPQSPPVGGEHSPVWQNCGIYDSPIKNENGVHSLEHGAVWVTYKPDLPASDVDQLRSKVRGHNFVLLSPYPGLNSPVVASAWGVQLSLGSVSDPKLAQFISAYEQGPQTPEPGASCLGGIGTPLN